MKTKFKFLLLVAFAATTFVSCSKKDEMKAEVAASWSVMLNAKNEILQ